MSAVWGQPVALWPAMPAASTQIFILLRWPWQRHHPVDQSLRGSAVK